MKHTALILVLTALAAGMAAPALADPDKDESGRGRHGRGHGRGEYKQEYWDGRCKVERKVGKHGEYKEERKCRAPAGPAQAYRPHHGAPPVVHAPAAPAPGIHVEPPMVIIQPPGAVIR